MRRKRLPQAVERLLAAANFTFQVRERFFLLLQGLLYGLKLALALRNGFAKQFELLLVFQLVVDRHEQPHVGHPSKR